MELDESLYSDLDGLLRRITRKLSAHAHSIVVEFDLTPPQFHALLFCRRKDNPSMKNLCQHLYLTSATVTGIVDRLEEKGLVSRVRDLVDRRSVKVQVTDAGEELLKKVLVTRQEVLAECLAGFDSEEQAQLVSLLERLSNSVDSLR